MATTEKPDAPAEKAAQLYRMVMEKHVCPYGIKSKWLLERHGYQVGDHHLETREETDAFMQRHAVETTPQTFIAGERIGGYDDLKTYFGHDTGGEDETTYMPVIAIFGASALMAVALGWATSESVVSLRTVEWFAAFAMTLLAVQKLRDIESFSTMFLNYDLLARRWVPYAYLYAFGEAAAGVLMLAGGVAAKIGAPIALFIGTIGAVSVFKAVYIDKRELKCACVGGSSNVPLGFVSLTENLVMMVMGIWMLVK
jgi:glutaredoxin